MYTIDEVHSSINTIPVLRQVLSIEQYGRRQKVRWKEGVLGCVWDALDHLLF